jgi:hypothetical protein
VSEKDISSDPSKTKNMQKDQMLMFVFSKFRFLTFDLALALSYTSKP